MPIGLNEGGQEARDRLGVQAITYKNIRLDSKSFLLHNCHHCQIIMHHDIQSLGHGMQMSANNGDLLRLHAQPVDDPGSTERPGASHSVSSQGTGVAYFTIGRGKGHGYKFICSIGGFPGA